MSHDLPSISRRSKKVNIIKSKAKGLGGRRRDAGLSPRVRRPENRKIPCQWRGEGRSFSSRRETFHPYASLCPQQNGSAQLVHDSRSLLSLIQMLSSNDSKISSKNTLADTARNVSPGIWTSFSQSGWHIKLTNHHTVWTHLDFRFVSLVQKELINTYWVLCLC